MVISASVGCGLDRNTVINRVPIRGRTDVIEPTRTHAGRRMRAGGDRRRRLGSRRERRLRHRPPGDLRSRRSTPGGDRLRRDDRRRGPVGHGRVLRTVRAAGLPIRVQRCDRRERGAGVPPRADPRAGRGVVLRRSRPAGLPGRRRRRYLLDRVPPDPAGRRAGNGRAGVRAGSGRQRDRPDGPRLPRAADPGRPGRRRQRLGPGAVREPPRPPLALLAALTAALRPLPQRHRR